MNTGAARTIALVPLRGDGKSRLDAAVGPDDRGALVSSMLDDVLVALMDGGVDETLILAGDRRATVLAAERALPAIADPPTAAVHLIGDARLRAAVDAALLEVPTEHVRLVVAADLPRLSAAEVAAVLDARTEIVIVPTGDGGTAVLRLAADVTLRTQYGPDSARGHHRAADSAGYTVTVLDLPGARHDVDSAEDLEALGHLLDGASPGPSTSAFIAGAGR